MQDELRNNSTTQEEIMSTNYFSDSDGEGSVARIGPKEIMDS
jgi:hypothetical protein